MSTPIIKISVSQADATLFQSTTLTAGMVNLPIVKFSFTDEWSGLGKTAVVRAGSVVETVLITNNQITVPVECLETAGVNLIVGVYGTDATVVIPTVWCSCGEILDGTDLEEAENVGTATESLVDQMLAYAQDIEGIAETLEDYAIRTVTVNTDGANHYGITSVTLSDSGSGDDRTLTFYFSNLKGNGIESITWSAAGEYRGRIQITTSDGQVTNFDALIEAINYLESLTNRAEAWAVGTIGGEPVDDDDPAYDNNAKYYAEMAEDAQEGAETAQGAAETAQGKAEDAQEAAEAAQTAAEAAQTAAETAQGKAEDAQDAAESAASDAATHENGAYGSALDSEAYAKGTRNSTTVGSDDPAYHNNSKYYSEDASASASAASGSATSSANQALKSEGYAVGKQNGSTVSSGSDYYHNNAKYYSEQASSSATDAAISASDAGDSKSAAAGSATAADNSKLAAGVSANAALNSATKAEGYALGTNNGQAVSSDSPYYHNNSKYYSEQAANSASDASDSAAAAAASAATFETDKTLAIENKAADAKATGDAIADLDENKADIDGYYEDMTVGNAEQLVATVGVDDNAPYNFRTTGGAADVGDRKTMEIVGGTVAWNQLVTTDTNVSKTKSGGIVSVNDAVAGNAQGLVVNFEPQQDLHGYDSPWPGGSGKNLAYLEQGTLNLATGAEESSTTRVRTNFIPVEYATPVGIYYVASSQNNGWSIRNGVGYDENKSYVTNGVYPSSTDGTFTVLDSRIKYVRFIYSHVNTSESCTPSDYWYQFERGLTPTTYAPYSNICPITGFTGCEATRTGENIYDKSNDILLYGYPSGSNTWVAGSNANGELTICKKLIERETYTATRAAGSYTVFRIQASAAYPLTNGQSLYEIDNTGGSDANEKTFTVPNGYPFVLFYVRNIYGEGAARSQLTVDDVKNGFQLEVGSTASSYKPYSGTTYPVSWQTEAGTVYGGTWNPVTGKLRAEWASHTYDGTENIRAITKYHYIAIPTSPAHRNNGSTDKGKASMFQFSGIDKPYLTVGNNTSDYWFWPAEDSDWYDDADAFKSYVAEQYANGTPLQICYPLDTPIEYTLTPQQIALLAGANNVWNDIGSTELTYLGTTNEIVAQTGHKYLTRINGTETVVNGSGQTLSGEKGRDNIFDLTQMFGSSIADYVYTLESGTTGAGVSWFTHLFPKPYYSYNAGQLLSVNTSSHITRGFNEFDEAVMATYTGWDYADGYYTGGMGNIPTKVWENKSGYSGRVCITFTGYAASGVNGRFVFHYTDGTEDFQAYFPTSLDTKTVVSTVGKDVSYIGRNFSTGGNVYFKSVCINLSWDGERDGEYEAYEEHVYPLDESLTLRGIPKLDSGNNLYYDGDTYEADGAVTRKYGIVDLGTLDWINPSGNIFRTNDITDAADISSNGVKANMVCSKYSTVTWSGPDAYWDKSIAKISGGNAIAVLDSSYTDADAFAADMSGVYLVYELATPTSGEADSYQTPQIIDDFGTEEFVDYGVAQSTREVAVPVGHNSVYVANLRAKLEMAPDSPDGDGDYIVRQTNGENEYVPLVIPQELPDLPSTNGTYQLQVTVSGSTKTLSWVST